MKTLITFFGTLAILIIAGISTQANAGALPDMEEDTIRLVIEGDTTVVLSNEDFEKIKELEGIDVDSLMQEIEAALDKVDENMKNIRIEETENGKYVTILSEEGEVLDEWRITENGKVFKMESDGGNNISLEIGETDDDKNIHFYMAFELGMNNYLEGQAFPDGSAQYTVKPWGSWVFGMGTGVRTYAADWFSVDWGADILWYNFKFEDRKTRFDMDETEEQIVFTTDPNPELENEDAIRSKLTVNYVNFNVVPVFHFGKKSRGFNKRMFRIGGGGYAGYRIGSYSKYVYMNDGNKDKDKDYRNFYLNNFRYGVKAIIGVNEMNLFFNYDLNSLFEEGKGPDGKELNAFSFGLNFTI